MFTVCPKCALTLVVTAADLRVAQGYVRCGRCSNVFNALARLSEDKGAPQNQGAAQNPGAPQNPSAAPSQGSAPPSTSTGSPPKPQSNGASVAPPAAPTRPPPQPAGSFVYTKPPETPASTPRPPQQAPSAIQPPRPPQGPGAPAPQASAPSSPLSRPTQQTAPPKPTPVAPIPATERSARVTEHERGNPAIVGKSQAGAGTPAAVAPSPRPLPIDLQLEDDDDAIPEDALEFNADADVNQFFIEPPPNPEWTAATGTFKAIVLKSEEFTPAPDSGPDAARPVTTAPVAAKVDPRHAYPPPAEFNSTFDDDEIELDADFLSGTAQMQKLQTDADGELIPPPRETPQPRETPPLWEPPQAREPLQPREASTARDPAPSREPPIPIQPPSPSHVAPSARMAPRGTTSPPEAPAPTRSRTPVAETPTRAPLKPIPVEFEKGFPEPEVVSVARTPIRASARTVGLEPEQPPLQRASLSPLARSVEATSSLESGDESLPSERSLLGSATLWTAGTGAMILLLAIQVVNHYRSDLAATPQFNKPITALYSALGIQLTPRWDLHAYDVRQLGASVDSANAGEIMVRASVKNGASQAQPMPLLRVTLQDRFGNRIAARDVPPGNYLPRATADVAYLPAGQRIDAEMAFVDPGSNAVGFEIDACLPAPAGGIVCANDSVSR